MIRKIKWILFCLCVFTITYNYAFAASYIGSITGSGSYGSPITSIDSILYIPYNSGIDVVDTDTNTVVDTINTGTDYGSSGESTQVGNFLYFSSHSSNLDIIDIIDNTLETTIPATSGYYHISPTLLIGDHLYVPGNNVDVIDVTNNTIIDTIITNENHYSYSTLKDGYLYIPNAINGISVIDTGTNTVVDNIYTPYGYDAINVNIGDYIYFPNDTNGITVVDTTDNTVVTNILTGHSHYSSNTLIGDYLYVPSIANGVDVIDTTNNTVIANIASEHGYYSHPTSVGNYLFLPNISNGIDIIDTTNNTLVTTINTGRTYYTTRGALIGDTLYVPNQSGEIDMFDVAMPPTAPLEYPDLVSGSDTGSSTTDNITNDASPSFEFTCDTNNTVTLYVDGIEEDSAVCSSGTATITVNLSSGSYAITYTETNLTGESGESPELNVVIDTTINTPTVSSPTVGSLNASPVNISGTCESSSTVSIYNSLITPNPTNTLCNSGTYSTSVTFGTVSYDPQTLSVIATDLAGNISATTTVSILTSVAEVSSSSRTRTTGYARSNKKEVLKDNLENKIPVVDEGLCTPYLTKSIVYGQSNNTEEVKKLQEFLNSYEGEKLQLTGTYDKVTQDAVIKFQKKYAKHILYPWNITEPTGNVYQTTRAKINALVCAKKNGCPYFSGYYKFGESNPEIKRIKSFLNLLNDFAKLDTNSSAYDLSTKKEITDFQTRYKDTVLKPWGITQATSYWYKTTKSSAEEILGCPAL
ncbi:MAG: hypothetical protein RLZZ517_640 [Candidatus Parcubacteria bacterium]|jgi:hypothetical protein